MKLLSQIQSGKQRAPRRIVVYGVHGVGKSTFASMAPNPIFIQTEDGLNDIGSDRFPLAREFDHIMTAISELYTEEHHYETVVVDSLDWLERLVWKHVCQQRSVENIEDFGYGKGYVFSLSSWRMILDGLQALRDDPGMTVILIAHCKVERFENPETDSYDRFAPRLNKHASALVQEWCDEVLFAQFKVHTKITDEGFGRKKAKGISTGERILRSTERPAHVAKNRLNLPEELPLDWEAYAHFLNSEEGKKNG